MASLVGPGITEKYFVPRFEVLCSDTLFHVRKVCIVYAELLTLIYAIHILVVKDAHREVVASVPF